MLGLAIHTSSPQLGLMLQGIDAAGEAVSRYQVWDLGRDVSSYLHVKMMEFMLPYCWQDLSFVAVAKGPGGFTGTRIGVVAARTLAQQLAVPLFGVSSLAAMGASAVHGEANLAADETVDKDRVIAMAAKRAAVFGAIYRATDAGDWVAVRADEVVPVEVWDQVLADWERPFVTVTAAAGEGLAESVQGVMKIAIARYQKGDRPDWTTVMPFYGQHPVHR